METTIVSLCVLVDFADAAEKVLRELEVRFPAVPVVDALGVVYPQYWLQGDCEVSFRKHLTVLKDFYGESRYVEKDGTRTAVPPVLDRFKLEAEQPLFKMAMLANSTWAMEPPPLSHDPSKPWENPVTKLWRRLDANSALSTSFPEYIKLAQIALIHVLGSVEDERAFSSLSFLKDKVRNKLDGDHLGLVVGMHNQTVYSLTSFPYEECFKQWLHSSEHHRISTMAYFSQILAGSRL